MIKISSQAMDFQAIKKSPELNLPIPCIYSRGILIIYTGGTENQTVFVLEVSWKMQFPLANCRGQNVKVS